MDWWIFLKARGEPKRRQKDQRDLERFAERRDRRFRDGKVGFRSIVNLRAPKALGGVKAENIKFINPDTAKEVQTNINPNARLPSSRNANIARQVRDQARAMKERKRSQELQSHFEGSGLTGAKKFMNDKGVQVHLPVRQEMRPQNPYKRPNYLGNPDPPTAPDRGKYDHPSEAFDVENIKQLMREGFKPSPNQLLQLPEGLRTKQGLSLADKKRQEEEEEEYRRREAEDLEERRRRQQELRDIYMGGQND